MGNALSLSELETRLRPGAWSKGGFLGPAESLADLLAHDEALLAQLGVSPDRIAEALEKLLPAACQHTSMWSPYPDLYHPKTLPAFSLAQPPQVHAQERFVSGN